MSWSVLAFAHVRVGRGLRFTRPDLAQWVQSKETIRGRRSARHL